MNFGDPTFLLNIVLGLVVFFLSLTVHEYAHARVAFALGDDTASRQGRLTLNPISHIDFIGTIIMPILGAVLSFTGLAVIGWAKPVPVNPARMSRKMSMRGSMALVAAAGPLSNLLLAILCTAGLWLLIGSGLVPEFGFRRPVLVFLNAMIYINIALLIFNLLPVPPLDGSRLMPRSLDPVMEFIGRYSFLFFILIIMFGRRIITVPLIFIYTVLLSIFGLDAGLVRFLSQ